MMYLFTVTNPSPDEVSDGEIMETTDRIFSTFIDKICDKLKEKGDFKQTRLMCIQNVNVPCGISLPKETLDKIHMTKNFYDLFEILCHTPYWNWMNIRMLEKMVGHCEPAKILIDQYKHKVFSRKLKDVLSDIPKLDLPTNEYTEVTEKWKKDFKDVTIKDVVEHWNKLEEKFNVKEPMLLKSIAKGCVEICWLLPNDLVEHAISYATSNQPVKYGDHQSVTQELFPEVLYLKIGELEVVVKSDITGM